MSDSLVLSWRMLCVVSTSNHQLISQNYLVYSLEQHFIVQYCLHMVFVSKNQPIGWVLVYLIWVEGMLGQIIFNWYVYDIINYVAVLSYIYKTTCCNPKDDQSIKSFSSMYALIFFLPLARCVCYHKKGMYEKKQNYRIILHKNTKTITMKTTNIHIPDPWDSDIASRIFSIVFLNPPLNPPISCSYI